MVTPRLIRRKNNDPHKFLTDLQELSSSSEIDELLQTNDTIFKDPKSLKVIAESNGIFLLLNKYSSIKSTRGLNSPAISLLNFLINVTYKDESMRFQLLSNEILLIQLETQVYSLGIPTLYRKYSKMVANAFSSLPKKLSNLKPTTFVVRYFGLSVMAIKRDYTSSLQPSKNLYIHEIFISWIKILIYNNDWIEELAELCDFSKFSFLADLPSLHHDIYRCLVKLIRQLLNHSLFCHIKHILKMNLIPFVLNCCKSSPCCCNQQYIQHTVCCGGGTCCLSLPILGSLLKFSRVNAIFHQYYNHEISDLLKRCLDEYREFLKSETDFVSPIKNITRLVYSICITIFHWSNCPNVHLILKRSSIIESIVQCFSLPTSHIKLKCVMTRIISNYKYDPVLVPVILKLNCVENLIIIMENLKCMLMTIFFSVRYHIETHNDVCSSNAENVSLSSNQSVDHFNLLNPTSSMLLSDSSIFPNKSQPLEFSFDKHITDHNDKRPAKRSIHCIQNKRPDFSECVCLLTDDDDSTFQPMANQKRCEYVLTSICEWLLLILDNKSYATLTRCDNLLRVFVDIASFPNYPFDGFVKNSYQFLNNFMADSNTFRVTILRGLSHIMSFASIYPRQLDFSYIKHFSTMKILENFYNIINRPLDADFFRYYHNLSSLQIKFKKFPPIVCDEVIHSSSFTQRHGLLRLYLRKACNFEFLTYIRNTLDKCTDSVELFYTSLAIPVLYHRSLNYFTPSQLKRVLRTTFDWISNESISFYYFTACVLSIDFFFSNLDRDLTKSLATSNNTFDQFLLRLLVISPMECLNNDPTKKYVFFDSTVFETVHVVDSHLPQLLNESANGESCTTNLIGSVVTNKKCLIDLSELFRTKLQYNLSFHPQPLCISFEPLHTDEIPTFLNSTSYQLDIIFHFFHVLHGCDLRTTNCGVNVCSFYTGQHNCNGYLPSCDRDRIETLYNFKPFDYYTIVLQVLVLCDKNICSKEVVDRIIVKEFMCASFTYWLFTSPTHFLYVYCNAVEMDMVSLQQLLIYYFLIWNSNKIAKLKLFVFILHSSLKEHFIDQLMFLMDFIVEYHSHCSQNI